MAKARRSLLDSLKDVEQSTAELTRQAESVEARRAQRVNARVDLAQIRPRPGGDSRPLNDEHVDRLAGNIEAVGLIQPIVVDRHQRLVAGGHRLAALQRLARDRPQAFAQHFAQGVLVHVFDLDAEVEADRAFMLEVAENEKRLDYTREQAIAMAEKLRGMGYVYREAGGAPRSGEKLLVPNLALIIGKSEKTVRRYLADAAAPSAGKAARPTGSLADLARRLEAVQEDPRLQPAERDAIAATIDALGRLVLSQPRQR